MASFPASVKSFTNVTDGVEDVMATHINQGYDEIEQIESFLQTSVLYGSYSNTETLAGTKTLADADDPLQVLDPGGAGRDVTLPAEATTNHSFTIVNAADAAELLTVKNDAGTTIGTLAWGESKIFFSNGTDWRMLQTNVVNPNGSADIDFTVKSDNYDAILVDASADGIAVMNNASGKVGFFGTAPVTRPSAYTQTYTTASKTVPNATASNPPAGGTGATAGAYDTAANRNLMITSLTNTIADVDALRKVVTQLIDDLQALGILQ